jgi:ribulose-5-phosphate 4-epimerase/fuculose-1-phosphate aldolase
MTQSKPMRVELDALPLAERDQRVNLAAAYQLAEHFGWTMLVWNHISARVPGTHDQFLINPLGFMYDEITASSLVKVDTAGNKIAGEGESSPAGFVIHGAVHEARHDVDCVLHAHTPEGVAVSCLKEGLPQLTGETAYFHNDIGYHEYEGVSLDIDERKRIAEALGDKNNLILKNHGLLTTGRSVGEAFVRMYWLIYCCKIVSHLYSMDRPYTQLGNLLADKTAEQDTKESAPSVFEWPALLRRVERIAPHYKT